MALLTAYPASIRREGRFRFLGSALSLFAHLAVMLPLVWLASASQLTTPPRLLTLHMVGGGGQESGASSAPLSPAPSAEAATPEPARDLAPAPMEQPQPEKKISRSEKPEIPARPAKSEKPAKPETPAKPDKQTKTAQTASRPQITNTASGSANTAHAASPMGETPGSSRGGENPGGSGEGSPSEPMLTRFSKPPYPRRSRQAGEEGKVVVEAHVSAQGQLMQAVVLHSSGHPRLDEAARASLAKAHFQPATRYGRPVEGKLRVPFVFSLRDEEGA